MSGNLKPSWNPVEGYLQHPFIFQKVKQQGNSNPLAMLFRRCELRGCWRNCAASAGKWLTSCSRALPGLRCFIAIWIQSNMEWVGLVGLVLGFLGPQIVSNADSFLLESTGFFYPPTNLNRENGQVIQPGWSQEYLDVTFFADLILV